MVWLDAAGSRQGQVAPQGRTFGPGGLPHRATRVGRDRTRSGSVKVNLALGELPTPTAWDGPVSGDPHRGLIAISPSVEYLERAWDEAKYGGTSSEPYIEAVFPSVHEPELAPEGKHIALCFTQFGAYELRGRDALGLTTANFDRLSVTAVLGTERNVVEIDRRRAKYAQVRAAISQDPGVLRDWAEDDIARKERYTEALALLSNLEETGDIATFRAELDKWARRPGVSWFAGFNQMFINQLAKRASDDPEPAGRLLAAALRMPRDAQEAISKIGSLVTHVELIKKAGQPAPARVPFITSLFWSIQDHSTWPCLWTSADHMLQALGWLEPSNDLAAHYIWFRDIVSDLDAPFEEIEKTLWWLDKHPFVGLDPALTERCAENGEILRRWSQEQGYGSEEEERVSALNSRAAQGELKLLGLAVGEAVSSALGHKVTMSQVQLRTAFTSDAAYRADAHVAFALEGGYWAPSIRVWATDAGVAVGAFPGYPKKKEEGEPFHTRLGKATEGELPTSVEFIRVRPARTGSRLEPAGPEYPGGDLLVGKWFPGTLALDREDFETDVLTIVEMLRPVLDRFLEAHGGKGRPRGGDNELLRLVDRFKGEQPYPTEKDEWHESERQRMAESLTPEALAAFDLATFRQIVSGNRYGSPGPQSRLNAELTNAGPAELERIGQSITTLLWDQDQDDATRIDRVLDTADLGVPGLGESVILKLLAIAHPERYIPVFPYTGEMGKRGLMRFIGLEPPQQAGVTRGQLQVKANDLLRERLEPVLPNDPWGQKSFLYWLRAQEERAPEGEADSLALLSEELLIEQDFIAEVVQLLRERRQLIFYGPPGTGKTYVARRLALALSPDPSRHVVVQFHPSTSYEDFFEGYRPDVTAEEQLRYSLVQGPLAMMAARAAETPGVDHIIIIDEINRANLPKVFGELLYLLEYRDEAVHTLYRPDEAFELPSNLYFIGTMNTADRSIALVDAAIRRRFHFVAFFPDEPPIEGLLARWLERQKEPEWIADFLDMVNEELKDRLGGSDLLLGPSYFMKRGLDEGMLARIWRYNVLPMLEELFYGQREVIEGYALERVLRRFRQQVASEEEEAGAGEAEAIERAEGLG
jgi:5-methylcytosine-specific restriction protein B